MEAHLAMAILELVRIRRRLQDTKTIETSERETLAKRIDKAFETANRFKILENQKRTERVYLLAREIVHSGEFPKLKSRESILPFDDLEKVIKELEGYFGSSAEESQTG